MAFTFQQPGTKKLLKALDAAARKADCGGGVFAFATKGGIEALLACPNIMHMLEHQRPFHLIVGVDAITNVEALLYLSEKVDLFKGALKANVFFHGTPGNTFHPKFSWFIQENVLKLLTGSGNLTLSGLGKFPTKGSHFGNWEAFSLQNFTTKFVVVKKQIDDWLAEQSKLGTLCKLDDERVREMAMFNARTRIVRPPSVGKPPLVPVPVDGVEFETPEVLVRELSSNRLGQADVGRAALVEFFGYIEGQKKKIFIQHVSSANQLGPVLEDHLFVNASSNYRLELRAITGLGYAAARAVASDGSHLILVATKLDHRSFRYTILPVTSVDHSQVKALLEPLPAKIKKGRHMREVRVTPDQLLAAWPKAPDNLLPIKSVIPLEI